VNITSLTGANGCRTAREHRQKLPRQRAWKTIDLTPSVSPYEGAERDGDLPGRVVISCPSGY